MLLADWVSFAIRRESGEKSQTTSFLSVNVDKRNRGPRATISAKETLAEKSRTMFLFQCERGQKRTGGHMWLFRTYNFSFIWGIYTTFWSFLRSRHIGRGIPVNIWKIELLVTQLRGAGATWLIDTWHGRRFPLWRGEAAFSRWHAF